MTTTNGKPRVLWIGDAAVSSGFARITHGVCDVLRETYDVHVLGINYLGDPHELPYSVYPCWPGGDAFGYGRVKPLVAKLKPDVVVVLNDPWNVPGYVELAAPVPVVASVAVDGQNCRGSRYLAGVRHAVFWTEFGLVEARAGGYDGEASVIPLGVDREAYRPLDPIAVRAQFRMPEVLADRGLPADAFVVGVVSRNQERKRFDLSVRYFARWVKEHDVRDAVLYVHTAPTGEEAFDLPQLAEYYGVADRLVQPVIRGRNGATDVGMARTYANFDALLSTSTNEGWGLPALEAMACGVPCVLPSWAAWGDFGWIGDAAIRVPCTSVSGTTRANVVGGVPDEAATVAALDRLYRDRGERLQFRHRGLALAARPELRWPTIGTRYRDVLDAALAGKP